MEADKLSDLVVRLKSGEYDGADVMASWLAIEELAAARQMNIELTAMVEALQSAINKAHKELNDEPDSPHLCDRIFHALDSVAGQELHQALDAIWAEVAEECAELVDSNFNRVYDGDYLYEIDIANAIRNMARKYKE